MYIMKSNTKTVEALSLIEKEMGITTSYSLAQKLNVAVTSIDRYKKSGVTIGIDKLADYAEKLGLEMEIKFNKKK